MFCSSYVKLIVLLILAAGLYITDSSKPYIHTVVIRATRRDTALERTCWVELIGAVVGVWACALAFRICSWKPALVTCVQG